MSVLLCASKSCLALSVKLDERYRRLGLCYSRIEMQAFPLPSIQGFSFPVIYVKANSFPHIRRQVGSTGKRHKRRLKINHKLSARLRKRVAMAIGKVCPNKTRKEVIINSRNNIQYFDIYHPERALVFVLFCFSGTGKKKTKMVIRRVKSTMWLKKTLNLF